MFDPHVRFEGFTHEDWRRLGELVVSPAVDDPPAGSESPRESAPLLRSGVVAVRRGPQLVKLVDLRHGRRPIEPADQVEARQPARLARRRGVRWAAVLDVGVMERIMDELGRRARPEDDFGGQLRTLGMAAGHEVGQGRLQLGWVGLGGRWLGSLEGGWLAMATGQLTRAIGGLAERICPPGRVAMLTTFAAGSLWTALVVRRGDRGVDAVVGPELLREHLRSPSGDLVADHRAACRVVEAELGPLSAALSARHDGIRRLATLPGWAPWSRAFAAQELVFEPRPTVLATPPWLAPVVARLKSWTSGSGPPS